MYEGVRRMRIVATTTFEAYVMPADNEDGTYGIGRALRDQIAHEVGDAVEYRAPHLTDIEPGDALIALVEGGGPCGAVEVDVLCIADIEAADAEAVDEAVNATKAWVFL